MLDQTFTRLNNGIASANELFAQKLVGKNIPLDVMFEITHKCNLKCVHCYNYDRSIGKTPHLESEMTSE